MENNKKRLFLYLGVFSIICCLCGFRTHSAISEEIFSIFPQARIMNINDYYEIQAFPDEIVIDTTSGSWDSMDVLNPSVLLYNGQFYNYYSGWDGEVWRTGLAVSEDGLEWLKQPDYLLDIREDQWDNTYIAANGSAVQLNDQVFYFYQGTDKANGRAQIGLAVSSDGFSFQERTDSPVLSLGAEGSWDSQGVADPYVISFGGKLYMYYLGMDQLSVQRIGVAVSDDGYNWVKYKNNPIMDVGVAGSFDENGLGEPSVIYKAPYFYMLYTGRSATEQRNIGFAVSLDGVNWKKLNYYGIIDLNNNSWDNQVICDTTLLETEDSIIVWYGGGNVASPDQGLNGKIGRFELSLKGIDDPWQFDANTWNSAVMDNRDFVVGSHGIEGDEGNKSVWVSSNIKVILKNKAEMNTLSVKGYVSMGLYQQVGIDRLTLEFLIDGQTAGMLEVTENGSIYQKIDKSAYTGEYLTVEIQASAYVNPKEMGTGADERDLSWILNGIFQE